ncbi:MAG TPA: Ger(x)C family spore germination protein [Symbiobacteriaceae bacterium]|nr:Ger(x)C family spore germination protein [Symbiobacteriaceae bacterium]
MQRKMASAIALLWVILLLGGCWDRAEVEDQAYVVMVGIDREPPDSFRVTALTAIVQQLGSGTLQAPVVPERPRLAAEVLTARSRTLGEAIQILNGGMTRRLDLRHLRAVMVGEKLARDGLEPLVMELLRSPLARTSAIFLQSRGTAGAVVASLRPVAETNPARMAEGITLQAKQLHLGPPVLLHHFLNRLAGGGGDSYLAAVAVNATVADDHGLPEPTESSTALPGELPRTGGNPVEVVGTAVFRGDRLAGYLNVDETQILLALRGKMGKAAVTMPDPLAPAYAVTFRFHQENFPRYRASFQSGRPRVAVHMLFEGEVLAIPSGVDYSAPAARQRLERAAAEYVRQTGEGMLAKLHDWQADPVGFGQLYRGRFATWQAWDDFNWHGRVKDLEVKVTAEMRVRRYGLMIGRPRANGGR